MSDEKPIGAFGPEPGSGIVYGPPSSGLAWTESTAFLPGRTIEGKYLVEKKLAEGGLGIVVVANHVKLEQRVAIKYLKPWVLQNAALVERFAREAQLAASIRSDHVVRVYDVGQHPEAGPFMVMEYLEGSDLGHILAEKGPLPSRAAVDYVLQACEALAEAHAGGIVHRDIKPDNLFLAQRSDGRSIVKILDFGISKVPQKKHDQRKRITGDDERFGTPDYMSPEQVEGRRDVDARTDIWSLGVVLFELMTGVVPFEGESVNQVTANILTGEPKRLRDLRPGTPLELDEVITRCLQKDRRLRYRNIAELAQELVPLGPAASNIDHIQKIVRDAGESIRPARPRASVVDVEEVTVPSLRTIKTVELLEPALHVRSRKPWLIAGLAFGALAIVACAVALLAGRHKGAEATPVASAVPGISVERAPEVPSPPETTATEAPDPALASSTPESTALASAAPRAAAASTTRAAAPPSARPPARAPTRQDDYAQFGERK